MNSLQTILDFRKYYNKPICTHAARSGSASPGLVACTMPFVLENGRPFVAIGSSEGIWVVDTNDPLSLHCVLLLKGVTEFAVIEEYHLLLVLADKSLYCCSLDALDPSNTTNVPVPQKLTGSASVDFFRVGIWSNALVVIYKRKRMADSVFQVLEPMLEQPPINELDPVITHLDNSRICYFRPLKDFYVPADCTDLVFLRSTISILHPRGFEIIDIETLSTATIPAMDDSRDKDLAKRCKGSKPLGLFRGKDGKHLLCYNTFGLFVDRHGEPIDTIEWNGTVSAVAPVAPYIVLFKAHTIEVRDGNTGHLEQVIIGGHIRCSWRGPGVLQGELDEDDLVPESANHRSRMQVVIRGPRGDETSQYLFDLVLSKPSPD